MKVYSLKFHDTWLISIIDLLQGIVSSNKHTLLPVEDHYEDRVETQVLPDDPSFTRQLRYQLKAIDIQLILINSMHNIKPLLTSSYKSHDETYSFSNIVQDMIMRPRMIEKGYL